jgi:hypothetical protein
MVVNTTRDKRLGVLYKPRHLPDRHLAVSPKSPPHLSSSAVVAASSTRCARPRRAPLLRPATLLRHVAPLLPDTPLLPDMHAAPSPAAGELGRANVRPHRRASPSPTRRISPTRRPSPTRPPGPDHPRRWPPALLLGGDPLPYSSATELLQPVYRASATASACRPPLRPPAVVRVPRWPAGPRWGFAWLTSAREILASASIFN